MSKAKIIEDINIINVNEDSNLINNGKIGVLLQEARNKKKLSLEDISQNLRIKLSYLEAIENSDYDNIPKPPYGIGFVRSYAAYLGLNSSRIVQIFKEETKQNTETNSAMEMHTNKKADANASNEHTNDHNVVNKKTILISLGMILFFYLLWSIDYSVSTTDESSDEVVSAENQDIDYPIQVETYNTTDETQPLVDENISTTDESYEVSNETSTNTSSSVLNETSPDTSSVKEEATKIENTSNETSTNNDNNMTPLKTGRVVLKIKKETWIEVKDKNKLWISKVLNAGDEYILPENGVGKTVSFGNTDGVDVVIDGKIVTIISNNKKTNIKMDAFLNNH